MSSKVIVVHCVDTEGPIGGNVRRRPDGSREFMGTWNEIMKSLEELTSSEFRREHQDSFRNPYKFNWFIMDFTGFKTNPKRRIAKYNNTYDHIVSLPTEIDEIQFHYHHPPANGIGDQWSDDWDSSQEYNNILAHRLIDRGDFPEVFRAGGTIEDNKCSLWLEENFLFDYSNRISRYSKPTNNIFDFNWYGAPDHWGFYHPSKEDFLKEGVMKRYIARCVDLKSRLCTLSQKDINDCFVKSKLEGKPILLSYFSHDHRDMREETREVVQMLNQASSDYSVPWQVMGAREAIQYLDQIEIQKVSMRMEWNEDDLVCISVDQPIFQKEPFVAIQSKGVAKRVFAYQAGTTRWQYDLRDFNIQKLGVAAISKSGDKSLCLLDKADIETLKVQKGVLT